MRERSEAIRYAFRELPRGGEALIRSEDAEAIRAIHESALRMTGFPGGREGP